MSRGENAMITRRNVLRGATAVLTTGALGAVSTRSFADTVTLPIDPETFSVEIKGTVDKPLKLSLADIKKLPAIEIVAVNQCSGNSRGFFEPRVAGGQLGNGAMGNARWKGVPLKAVLDKAGVQQGAKQVVFGGLDGPIMDTTPDFAKALD